MDVTKDYYAILGVLPSVEIDIIKAVYRTHMKKWHPDVVKEDYGQASEMAVLINEAYDVLSDPRKRAAYDTERRERKTDSGTFGDPPPFSNDPLDDTMQRAWDVASDYYPEICNIKTSLQRISHELGIIFQSILIERKLFRDSFAIARSLEAEFLLRYFGGDEEIRAFAKHLLQEGDRKIAIELNKTINIIGKIEYSDEFIEKFCELHGVEYEQI